MTEERLREIEAHDQYYHFAPDEVRELLAEIRRLQAENASLRPVFEAAKKYLHLCNNDEWINREDPSCCDEWEPLYDRLWASVVDAVDAAKEKEE